MASGIIPNSRAVGYHVISTTATTFDLDSAEMYLVQIAAGSYQNAALFSVYVSSQGDAQLVKFAESGTAPATVSVSSRPAKITVASTGGNAAIAIIKARNL